MLALNTIKTPTPNRACYLDETWAKPAKNNPVHMKGWIPFKGTERRPYDTFEIHFTDPNGRGGERIVTGPLDEWFEAWTTMLNDMAY